MYGPQPILPAERRQRAQALAARLQAHFGARVQAIGVYGSLARQTDGPYSDIEMYCILKGKGIDSSLEWSAGPWKAEIDLYSPDVLLAWAETVEHDWPITHGALLAVWALYDPHGFFARLRQAALDVPDSAFEAVLQPFIVGEIYEMVGKIRNALAQDNPAPLPAYAVELATYGACLVGLLNRHTYRTFGRLYADSLALPGAPEGYAALCELVMAGRLDSPAEIGRACDEFWEGIEHWASGRALQIHSDFETLLLNTEIE